MVVYWPIYQYDDYKLHITPFLGQAVKKEVSPVGEPAYLLFLHHLLDQLPQSLSLFSMILPSYTVNDRALEIASRTERPWR